MTQLISPTAVSTTTPSRRAQCCIAAPPQEDSAPASLLKRTTIFAYGLFSYAVFFATFLYACGFVGNFLTPTRLDAAPPPHSPLFTAILINAALLLLFAVQHSVMARPWFKARWTRLIPEPAERSTYVLFSSLALIALFILWQPMGIVIWHVDNPIARAAIYTVFAAGWGLVLLATFLINHFDLFGLRQVWLYLRGRPYTHLPFKTPGPYRLIRHPLYAGWFLGFWATPHMTAAHLLFALLTSVYILAAIQWEERDLITHLGHDYTNYRRRVPMLIPRLKRSAR